MSDLNVLTTTAAALASGNPDSVVLSQLKPLLHDKNGQKRLLKSHRAADSSLGLIEQDFTRLTAEDLHDLPDDPDVSFSLFQGFTATVPEVLQGTNATHLIEYNEGITLEKINHSQSTKALKAYQRQLNFTLDLLSIKRGTALDEIKVIDSNIDKLYILRSQLTDSIKSSEKETNGLNELLVEIERRLEVVEVVNDDDDTDEEFESLSSHLEDSPNPLDDESFEAIAESTTVDHEHDNEPHNKNNDTTNEKTKHRKHRNEKLTIFQAHDSPVTSIASNSNKVVTASLDNTVRVWDLTNKPKCTGLLEGHLSVVQCMDFDNTMLATGSNDATVKLWDLTTNDSKLVHSFESHIDEITALSFQSGELVSASQDKTIRQWDIQSGKLIQTIDVLWANSIMLNSTHSMMMSVPSPIDDPQLEYTTVLGNKLPFITTLKCLSPALASGTSDGLIRLWDLRSGDVIRQFQGHQSPIMNLDLDHSGKLISGDVNGQIRVWDLRNGTTDKILNLESNVVSCGFGTHNDSVVSVLSDGLFLDEQRVSVHESGSDVPEEAESFVVSCAELLPKKAILGTTEGSVMIYKM